MLSNSLPNFLIIGAAKSGTTALHQYLAQHPQIYMSPVKETKFFVFEDRDVNYQGPGDLQANRFVITALADYQAQFLQVKDEIAIGESSPLYLYHPIAPQRIHHYIPEVKLVAILRNPVDRAYSSFLHLVSEGRESVLDFGQALEAEEARIANNWALLWHYHNGGLYYRQLERYFNQFDSGKIRLYLYEDLCNQPIALLQDIFDFLEVDPGFMPNIDQRHNVSLIPRNRYLHDLLTRPSRLKRLMQRFLSTDQTNSIVQWVQRQNLGKPKLDAKLRQKLILGFQDDIMNLQDLIDRDLSHWLLDQ
jgi:hypothetical protein